MIVAKLLARFRKTRVSKTHKQHLISLIHATAHLGEVDEISPKEWKQIRASWAKGGWTVPRKHKKSQDWKFMTREKKRAVVASQRVKSKGWCMDHIKIQFQHLKHAIRWGASEGLCTRDAFESISLVKHDMSEIPDAIIYEKIGPVPREHVEAIKPFVTRLIWDLIEVQWLTGMRSSEVLRLNSREIERHGDVWLYRPVKHKTSRFTRTKLIAIGPKAIEILNKYWRDGYLFPWRDTHFPMNQYMNRIIRGIKRAGSPHWHPHQLRHSRAKIVNEQLGMEAAAAMLGDTITVAKIYAERNQKLAIESARIS